MVRFDRVFHNEIVRTADTENYTFCYCPLFNDYGESTYDMSGWSVLTIEGDYIDGECWEDKDDSYIIKSCERFEKYVKKFCSSSDAKEILTAFHKTVRF